MNLDAIPEGVATGDQPGIAHTRGPGLEPVEGLMSNPSNPTASRCCPACAWLGNRCQNPDCACHHAAAKAPDLAALAQQQEDARGIGPEAFGFARCAFVAGVRETMAQTRELAS